MGQQQLLLVILVTILVGIATVVAINVFGSAAENANRDAVRQDLIQAASSLQAIWARPRALGGVSGDFANTAVLPDAEFARQIGIFGTINQDGTISNENATYEINRGTDQVTITGDPLTYSSDIVLLVQRTADADIEAGEDAWTVRLTDTGTGIVTEISGPAAPPPGPA